MSQNEPTQSAQVTSPLLSTGAGPLEMFLCSALKAHPELQTVLQLRLRKIKLDKRPNGRPRTRPIPDPTQKRPPGRPRIHPIVLPEDKLPPGRPRINPRVTRKRPLWEWIDLFEFPTPDPTSEKTEALWHWEEAPKEEPTEEEHLPGIDELEWKNVPDLLFQNPYTPPPDISPTEEEDSLPETTEPEKDTEEEPDEELQKTEKERIKADGTECLDLYYREIRDHKPLTLEEEIELGTRYHKHGCQKSFDKMVEANLKLVVHIAKRFRGMLRMFSSSLSFADLISEGNIGLLKAIERYEPERRNKISTYASWWITQQIQAALQKQGKIIRIPTHLLQKMRKIQRILDEYQNNHLESEKLDLQDKLPPDLLAILESSGFKESDVQSIKGLLNLAAPSISLDDPSLRGSAKDGSPKGASLHESIQDENAENPYETFATLADSAHIASILETLKPKERAVIEARYGLNGQEAKTLEQVGEIHQVTRERIRQIQDKALKKMRRKINEINKTAQTKY